MKTYFAAPEKVDSEQLELELKIVNSSPVISGLLNIVGGVLAVLNEHRQIITVNTDFLEKLGFDNPEILLGLRTGEVLECNYSNLEKGGCGTSRYCSTCGAALAIVSALNNEKAEKRICVLSCTRGGSAREIAFLVRAHLIRIQERQFILLFLQDITIQQQRAALERAFFHDIKNIVSGMMSASELISSCENSERQTHLAEMFREASVRLNKEVDIQRSLLEDNSIKYQPLIEKISYFRLADELKNLISAHTLSNSRKLNFTVPDPDIIFRSDRSLLIRIISNMIINALEATEEGGEVKFWSRERYGKLIFYVWNNNEIPENIKLRIFQRNFSTKDGDGRGIGTYSMKLFGETILGGKIDFSSSEEEGTIFCYSLPLLD